MYAHFDIYIYKVHLRNLKEYIKGSQTDIINIYRTAKTYILITR